MFALCRCDPDSFRESGRVVLDVILANQEESLDAEGRTWAIKQRPGTQYVIVEYDAERCAVVAAEDPDDHTMVWVRATAEPQGFDEML